MPRSKLVENFDFIAKALEKGRKWVAIVLWILCGKIFGLSLSKRKLIFGTLTIPILPPTFHFPTQIPLLRLLWGAKKNTFFRAYDEDDNLDERIIKRQAEKRLSYVPVPPPQSDIKLPALKVSSRSTQGHPYFMFRKWRVCHPAFRGDSGTQSYRRCIRSSGRLQNV